MFAPNLSYENALRFSRFDTAHPLASSGREIFLEERDWPSAEHYLHVKLAGTERLAALTLAAGSAYEAYRLNKAWFRPKKSGWKQQRRVYMTRALYTQVQMYSDIRAFLLDSGEQMIAETSQYDHYWGIGRDQRGENMMGHVWMDIRTKLRQSGER